MAFYYQITPVQETYKDANGRAATMDLPLITLPPGTVLFRGMKIPNPANVDVRLFYRDYLGDPEGSRMVCMRATHNVFFYPFPYIAFGANDVGKTFDMMQMVVLVHPMTVVCSISPSQWVRGTALRFTGQAPYRRCDSFPLACHPPTADELKAQSFDNCLDPEYQARSNTRGWMALADLDSFNPKGKVSTNSAMSSYMRKLEERQPGKGAELAAWSYTDANRHHGFPEISLYPYKSHPGNLLIKRSCSNHEAALRLMQKEAEADNLNYLPIATFTEKGTVDMVKGFFTYEALGVAENSFSSTANAKQSTIEQKMTEYMDMLQTKGVFLPHFGPGKLSLDTRTGFYILPQVLKRLTVPLGAAGVQETQPYRYLALPLDTPEAKKHALTYILMFRNVVSEKFMEKYGLDKGFGIRRAMVFDRPPVLPRVFDELGLDVPPAFRDGLRRAAALHQGEKKQKPEAKTPTYGYVEGAPLTSAPGVQAKTPIYGYVEGGPMTPAFTPPGENKLQKVFQNMREGKTDISDVIGGYGKPINPYKLSEEELDQLVAPSPPYRPSTPNKKPTPFAIGGTRKHKLSHHKRSTRKRHNSLEEVAKMFSKVWLKKSK